MARCILLCCVVFMPVFAWSLKCYRCEGTVSECQKGSKELLELDCTPANDLCYITTIKRDGLEIEQEQGCTDQVTCDISKKSCENSGDCTSKCCKEDKCNAEGPRSLPCIALMVTGAILGLFLVF